MTMFSIFQISGSAMQAQSQRMNVAASNLANAESVSSTPEGVYKARHPIFEAVRAQLAAGLNGQAADANAAVRVRGIYESQAPAAQRYEPGNPLADPNGYVYAPAVNVVEEMVNMISASRSYQNNVEVMNTSKDLMMATLRLGQG